MPEHVVPAGGLLFQHRARNREPQAGALRLGDRDFGMDDATRLEPFDECVGRHDHVPAGTGSSSSMTEVSSNSS